MMHEGPDFWPEEQWGRPERVPHHQGRGRGRQGFRDGTNQITFWQSCILLQIISVYKFFSILSYEGRDSLLSFKWVIPILVFLLIDGKTLMSSFFTPTEN